MLTLDILTPDGPAFEGTVESVSLPTLNGEITVLKHHIPLITVLVPGTAVIRQKGTEELLAVSRGMIEIDGSHVRVLADSADVVDAMDIAGVEESKKRAEELLAQRKGDIEGFAEAQGILDREIARLHTVRRRHARSRLPS
jgi:F-type H+-transporting ATPase subunit epsilon